MIIEGINEKLAQLAEEPVALNRRSRLLEISFAIMDWMGITPNENYTPQIVAPKTQRLHEYLLHSPRTTQAQLYRMSAKEENIRIRFAVLKKLKKEYISRLVDNDPGLTSYQAFTKNLTIPEGHGFVPSQPYYIHFVTTPDYDKLVLIFNQGEQKRLLTFRNKLTQTQFNKIVLQWQGIGKKSKAEIAAVLWKSLDIKEVNKEFYKQVKERFDALVGILKNSPSLLERGPGGEVENDIKQFAVRLIGRFIFCWFLKEKGIIPHGLLSSATIEKYKTDYYQKYLLHLFFNTLNTEVQNRDPLAMNGNGLSKLFEKIPYLNGGLFEIHEQDKHFNKTDINGWMVNFVQVLDSFDFTVDESSAAYQIVAIDPEMLGRIFENLLASQNPDTEKMANQRNAFGAFYTSREIVDYMVDASLKAYLEEYLMPEETAGTITVNEPAVSYSGTLFQHLEPQQTKLSFSAAEEAEKKKRKEQLDQKLIKLFSPAYADNPFDKSETAKVQQALRHIKVLDPACGSGAFPMSMLLRLMQLREKVGNSLSNAYELKNDILSHNIYGVDIMPMAVEIARLRAWLSLVLEAEYKPADTKHNFNIKALPNLDFKFVCANTLIDSGYEAFLENVERGGSLTLLRLDGEIQKLEQLRHDYFDPKGDQQHKYRLRKEFLETQQYIKTEFHGLRKTWNLDDFLNRVDDWKPFNDNHPSSFFSSAWMFGVQAGFDVVIGNPPYVQIQKMEEARKNELEAQRFETFERTGDLYQLFYEKGIQLLKRKGILSYITSNKWMRTNYGECTRSYFAKHITPVALVDFGMALVFESATILTNILIGKRNGGSATIPMCRVKNDFTNPADLENYILSNTIEIKNPGADTWVAYDKNEYALIKKIEEQGVPLNEWVIVINYGIKTGYNDAFIINEEKRKELIAADARSAEIIKPILRGEDIAAYVPEFAGLYLINSHNGVKAKKLEPVNVEKDYPAVYAWLNKHKEKLFKRQDQGDHWTNLRNCAYMEEFSKPKIIYPNMTKYLPFMFDENTGYYCNDKAFIITGDHIKYLAAVLNSSLWKFAFKERFPELLGETREVRKVFFDKIPIKKPVGNYEKQLSGLTDKIIAAKKAKQDTAALEKEVDVLVYHLYGLAYSEAQLIDPALTQEEFENCNPA